MITVNLYYLWVLRETLLHNIAVLSNYASVSAVRNLMADFFKNFQKTIDLELTPSCILSVNRRERARR